MLIWRRSNFFWYGCFSLSIKHNSLIGAIAEHLFTTFQVYNAIYIVTIIGVFISHDVLMKNTTLQQNISHTNTQTFLIQVWKLRNYIFNEKILSKIIVKISRNLVRKQFSLQSNPVFLKGKLLCYQTKILRVSLFLVCTLNLVEWDEEVTSNLNMNVVVQLF